MYLFKAEYKINGKLKTKKMIAETQEEVQEKIVGINENVEIKEFKIKIINIDDAIDKLEEHNQIINKRIKSRIEQVISQKMALMEYKAIQKKVRCFSELKLLRVSLKKDARIIKEKYLVEREDEAIRLFALKYPELEEEMDNCLANELNVSFQINRIQEMIETLEQKNQLDTDILAKNHMKVIELTEYQQEIENQ
ncbi:hypothetical protein [Bacillus cereus group sp. TH152-1LC]|uniref:hypothetical protein n=1 Tax=Bacillus cereus group sp. TH152-1LC TaxID=3018060 RepID=UPI0022E343F3|nr:hypothetical protein [Bacillus cereus group sp. TH152-1LC]MDA1674985.1 hypothetical protein [Bacillus cereus group sp. TH152-1LC]